MVEHGRCSGRSVVPVQDQWANLSGTLSDRLTAWWPRRSLLRIVECAAHISLCNSQALRIRSTQYYNKSSLKSVGCFDAEVS